MRKLEIYSLFDQKSKQYDTPFFTRDDIAAKRHFIMVCRNPKTLVSSFPDDFSLVQLGQFDCVTGKMDIIEPITILTGKEIAKEKREEN